MEKKRGLRKVRIGEVTSDKMDKTAVIAVEHLVKHPVYKKYIRRTSKFKAHDPSNECQAGDVVRIIETRPLSKTKRWRVTDIIEKVK